jgi:hypothetical protein
LPLTKPSINPKQGQLVLVTGTCSRITPTTKDQHIDTAWASRVARGDTAVFATHPLTSCRLHLTLPRATVRQVLQQRWDGVGGTFRLMCRIIRQVRVEFGFVWAKRVRFEQAVGWVVKAGFIQIDTPGLQKSTAPPL